MARRRNITSSISTDARVNQLAREHGEFCALLYTWMIPAAEDDATLRGNAEEIRLRVCPGLLRTQEDIEAALLRMHEAGLLVWDGERAWFPPESFYKTQSYIPQDKRRSEQPVCGKPPKNAAKRRKTAKNTVTPSPTPSLSPSPLTGENISADPFERFWAAYPRKRERAAAARCFRRLVAEGVSSVDLIAAAEHYATYVAETATDDQYVAYGSTFLGPKRKFEDFVAGVPEDRRRSQVASNGARNAIELVREMGGGESPDARRGDLGPGSDRRVLPEG